MASYWLKLSASDSPVGPYTGTQLKTMAARGTLSRAAFVSADQQKWIVAAKVKGLFPEEAVAPEREPPPPPVPTSEHVEWIEEVPEETPASAPIASASPQAPLGYAHDFGRQRNVKWFLTCSIIILGMSAVQLMISWGGMAFMLATAKPTSGATTTVTTISGGRRSVVTTRPPPPRPSTALLATAIIGLGLRFTALAGWIGLSVYFFVWVYQVHADMQQLTRGAYPISPGQACGFCFIPFFNIYWIVYMPYKLAEAIDWHLGSNKQVTNPSTVMAFQILQLVTATPCMCFSAPSPIFYALSMQSIQTGLNEMWARGSSAPMSP